MLDGSGWLTPRPDRFTARKETRYPLYRRLGGPQGRSGWVREISPPQGILFCFLYFYLYYFFLLIVLAVPFVLTVQHTTQTSMPPAGFETAIPAGERLQTQALDRSATEICWIRTRNPSKPSVAHLRLRPLGYWDRLRSLDRPASGKSLHRLRNRSPAVRYEPITTQQ